MDTSEHAGRSVVVTGAASGIGAAVAQRFALLAARVVLADRDGDRLEGVVERLREQGGQVLGCPTDVTSTRDDERLVDLATTRHGPVDLVVAAAGGFSTSRPAEQIGDDEWEAGLALNLTGAFRTARAAIPGMKRLGRGQIVFFTASEARMQTPAGRAPAHYTAAKAGVVGLTQQLAVELGPFGIRVNAVAPGTTRSPRVQAHRTAEELDAVAAGIPLRRIASLDDQVGPVVFLASRAAAYVTGATLDVNGGRLMF